MRATSEPPSLVPAVVHPCCQWQGCSLIEWKALGLPWASSPAWQAESAKHIPTAGPFPAPQGQHRSHSCLPSPESAGPHPCQGSLQKKGNSWAFYRKKGFFKRQEFKRQGLIILGREGKQKASLTLLRAPHRFSSTAASATKKMFPPRSCCCSSTAFLTCQFTAAAPTFDFIFSEVLDEKKGSPTLPRVTLTL